jgi:RNAse (barnase) inhibitor barstar
MNEPANLELANARGGVYAAPHALDALRLAAAGSGIAWCDLDLTGVTANRDFLVRCAAAMKFPDTFGCNWDALADCLEDLSWLPAAGVVVYWRGGGDFARRSRDDLATALEIFSAAANYWQERSRLLLVLLDAPSRGGQAMPQLSSR